MEKDEKVFQEFLDDALCLLSQRIKNGRPLPKGLKRFEYDESSICEGAKKKLWHSTDIASHESIKAIEDPHNSKAMKVAVDPDKRSPEQLGYEIQISETYRKAFEEEGDSEAIFELARDDREALRRPWVIDQLITWRLTGSTAAHRDFSRFMRLYWGEWGKRNDRNTVATIERDQKVYKALHRLVTSMPVHQAIAKTADRLNLSSSSVELVRKQYSTLRKRVLNTSPHAMLPRRHR